MKYNEYNIAKPLWYGRALSRGNLQQDLRMPELTHEQPGAYCNDKKKDIIKPKLTKDEIRFQQNMKEMADSVHGSMEVFLIK